MAWALSRADFSPGTQQIIVQLTADADPAVARAAWEALATTRDDIDPDLAIAPDWAAGLTSTARRVRAAAIAVARGVGRARYDRFLSAQSDRTTQKPPALRLAELWIKVPDDTAHQERIVFTSDDFRTCLQCFAAAGSDTSLALESVRLLQVGLGDLRTAPGQAEVYTGYAAKGAAHLDAATREAIVRQLAPAFPTAHAELNRELARLLGMLEADDDRLLGAIAGRWTDQSSVEDDVHYLIVASLLSGNRSSNVTAATARCLLRLHAKLDAQGQFASRNWPFRLGEAFDQLCRRDPALAKTLNASDDFGHPEHTMFVAHLPKSLRPIATQRIWFKTVGAGQDASAELIALVGSLPEKETIFRGRRTMLISQWDHVGLRDGIVLALSKSPNALDRDKFIEALSSPQADVVRRAAVALVTLGMDCTSAEMAAALRALKQACSVPKATEPRESLLQLLDFWTEGNGDVDLDPDPSKAYVGWFKLFDDYYPAEAARLKSSSGADAETWRHRLDQVAWNAGEAARGRAVFERRACHRCHEAAGHLGPELKGAVARLSREDLFTAITDPNLEVSPAFQTTVIATNSGQVYHGVIVYESPEGTLLQTGPDTTVRITDAEQSSVRRSTRSLMPTGLLDTLSDQDLSDLYAYLRTLSAK